MATAVSGNWMARGFRLAAGGLGGAGASGSPSDSSSTGLGNSWPKEFHRNPRSPHGRGGDPLRGFQRVPNTLRQLTDICHSMEWTEEDAGIRLQPAGQQHRHQGLISDTVDPLVPGPFACLSNRRPHSGRRRPTTAAQPSACGPKPTRLSRGGTFGMMVPAGSMSSTRFFPHVKCG